MRLTKTDIKKGLRRLGLKKGAALMVHSSLSSLGEVIGGAEALIDALLETVGKEGTIMMPAFGAKEVFHIKNSRSILGRVTEVFRKQEGTLRSLHPFHAVCASGKKAKALIRDHIKAETSCGKNTPHHRLIRRGGYILLIGVDQDRSTLLHTPEVWAKAQYLKTRCGKYYNRKGKIKTKTVKFFPGPHRNFIGLDPAFRKSGIMKIGKIGNAVVRLIDARAMFKLVLKAIKKDPALYLCRNPHCWDCVRQRHALGRPSLKGESFRLSVLADEVSANLGEVFPILRAEGIRFLELKTASGKEVVNLSRANLDNLKRKISRAHFSVSAINITSRSLNEKRLRKALIAAKILGTRQVLIPPPEKNITRLVRLAEKEKIKLLLENSSRTSSARVERIIERIDSPYLRLAFNPAHFAKGGEKPFLGINSHIRKMADQFYISDALFEDGPFQPVGFGNGEVKELVSALRCRSFPGFFTLKIGFGKGKVAFIKAIRAFWDLLETM